MKKLLVVGLTLSFLGLLHQKLFAGEWFNWQQVWHHETLIAILMALVVGVWAGTILRDNLT